MTKYEWISCTHWRILEQRRINFTDNLENEPTTSQMKSIPYHERYATVLYLIQLSPLLYSSYITLAYKFTKRWLKATVIKTESRNKTRSSKPSFIRTCRIFLITRWHNGRRRFYCFVSPKRRESDTLCLKKLIRVRFLNYRSVLTK